MSKYSQVKVFELNTKVAGKGIALNYGVENSTGNYILVLGSDSLLTKDFIENVASDENYAAAQGRYVPSNRNFNFVTRMLALHGDLLSTPFMTEGNVLGSRTLLGATGYIVLKDVLAKMGMFTNYFVNDCERTFCLLRNGYKISICSILNKLR